MNRIAEHYIAEIRRAKFDAERSGLNLRRNYPLSVPMPRAVKLQELINQTSREAYFTFILTHFLCSEISFGFEELSACVSALEETLPLLEGSRYAEFQRGRIEDFRKFAKRRGFT